MNKKGFTLIEVILVVAILAMLIIILVPNVFVLVEKNKEKSCNNLIKNIESSTKIYVTNNKYILGIKCYNENDPNTTIQKITLGELVDSGDLKIEENKIINPLTNTEVPLTNVVYVRYDCNTHSFTYEVTGIDCINN